MKTELVNRLMKCIYYYYIYISVNPISHPAIFSESYFIPYTFLYLILPRSKKGDNSNFHIIEVDWAEIESRGPNNAHIFPAASLLIFSQ